MVSLYTLFGIVVTVTSLSLLAALAGWYYCLATYREELGERPFFAMKYVLPPFLLLTATPLFDVVFWVVGIADSIPFIGTPGLAIGLAGVGVVLAYVVYDLRYDDTDAGVEVGAGTS